MMMDLDQPYFHNEEAAYRYFEQCVWPEGPVCPRCGEMKRLSKIKANIRKRIRRGLYLCHHCHRQFTAKVGTVFESSHLPMHQILVAYYLMACSKTGISSLQIKRILHVDYKTAWFLTHRIREAMKEDAFPLFGQNGGAVEVDETSVGDTNSPQDKVAKNKRKSPADSMKVLSIVDRQMKMKRSFVLSRLSKETIVPKLRACISKYARLMTDRASYYQNLKSYFPHHQMVKHMAKEYVNADDPTIHTNTVEGSFSTMKRGHFGTYMHWSEQHCEAYIAEFEFRSNHHTTNEDNDLRLTKRAVMEAVGKRMTYKPSKLGVKSLVA